MKKLVALCLGTTLILGTLASCSSEDEAQTTQPPVTTAQPDNTTPEIMPEVAPETEDFSFVMPEHYAHLEEQIAKVFVSVPNMPDFIYVPNMPLDTMLLEEMFGISPDLYSDFHGEVPMMSQQADQLLLFKTEDSAPLVEALEAYLAGQRANLSQYPSTLTKLEVAVVEEIGDYVFLNMLSSYPENESTYSEEDMMAFYKDTIATVSAEIKRVLEGGEPNPDRILDYAIPEENTEEFLGEYITPQGPPSHTVIDIENSQPATPPEGDIIYDSMGIPAVGEETGGHAPAEMPMLP